MADIDSKFFERVLVKHAMLDSAYLAAISDYVQPKYFEDKNIAKYFQIVADFYDRRQRLPTITEVKTYLTTDALRNGFRNLVESFKDIDSSFDKDELYDNTEKFLKDNAYYHAVLESAEIVSDPTADRSPCVEKFEKIAGINLNMDWGIELFGDMEKMLHDIANVESTISTGYPWLNDAIQGGWSENGKALYLFGGEANIGKSIFLGDVAAKIAEQNKTVLIITLEMSELLYAKRISSNITKIPMSQFRDNIPSLRESLKDKKQELPNGRIYIKEFPPSTVTPKQLAAFIKKLRDSGVRIDAIVIDYITLLHTTFGSNSYERIKYICEQVRAMSYPRMFGCPIISAVQLNRSSYGNANPGMDGIAESIGVAATADVIISIFQNEEDREMKLIKLGMMKNRFGPRGMVQAMKIDYSTLSITQSGEEAEVMNENDLSLLEKLANA